MSHIIKGGDQVVIILPRGDYEKLAAEAVMVDDLGRHDREYSGGSDLADMVLEHCIDPQDKLSEPKKPVEVQAVAQSDGSYTLPSELVLGAGDKIIVTGISVNLTAN